MGRWEERNEWVRRDGDGEKGGMSRLACLLLGYVDIVAVR